MAGRQDWRTPPWLFEILSERFGPYKLDAAASKENSLCGESYYDGALQGGDGLNQPWIDPTFCNPPFNRAGDWAAKAHHEWSQRNVKSTLILPAGCSQRWFHEYVLNKAMVLYPTKRIQFCLPDGSPSDSANGDSMIVVYGFGVTGFCGIDLSVYGEPT